MRAGMGTVTATIVIVAAGLVAACTSSDAGDSDPAPPAVAVSHDGAWAGSTITVRSTLFSADSTSSLWLGDSLMDVTRVDDTTLAMTIPSTFSGSYHLTAGSPAHKVDAGTLVVYGAVSFRTYPVTFWDGEAQRWPLGPHAAVAGFTDNAMTVVDLEAGTFSSFTPGRGELQLHEPGPTSIDSVFVTGSPTSDSVEVWKIGSVPTEVSAASKPDNYAGVYYDILMPEPGQWWWLASDWIRTPVTCTTIAGPEGFDRSPDASRLVVLADGTAGDVRDCPFVPVGATQVLDGAPVFDVASGQLAFTVPQIRNPTGDAFSSDGQLLAITGGDVPQGQVTYASPGHLTVVDAASGTVRADTLLDRPAWSAAFDPARSLLYVLVSAKASGDAPTVLVLDPSTLREEGEMHATTTDGSCCAFSLLVMGSDSSLYAFAENGSKAWRFALPPAGNALVRTAPIH